MVLRRILQGVSVYLLMGLFSLVNAQTDSMSADMMRAMLKDRAPVSLSGGGEVLQEIPAITSENGVLEATLRVKYQRHRIGDSRAKLRSYVADGSARSGPWGPTLRLQRNDRLVLDIVNELPPNLDGMPADHNIPHHFNTTNIHTHGLHVSPIEDDIFRRIPPSHVGRYQYQLNNHIGGTFWYHPHVHGSTSIQVASGMSGVIVVEGDFDHIPLIREAPEKVLLFNQIVFEPGAGSRPGSLEHFDSLWPNGTPPEGTTVNGQVKPVIEMRPNEVQRWRVVHSGFSSTLSFAIESHELHQIAADGIPFKNTATRAATHLAPGNRADFLVQASSKPGDYLVRPVVYDALAEFDFEDGGKGNPPTLLEGHLAVLRVTGDAVSRNEIPRDLSGARVPNPICERDVVNGDDPRKIEFTMERDPMAHRDLPTYRTTILGVNGKRFSHHRIDHTLSLGSAEAWTLKGANHPFHIHVNPFLIIEVGGRRLATPVWKDTQMIPEGGAKVLTRYERYTGDFVLHCHVLTHEEVGMMQRVRIE